MVIHYKSGGQSLSKRALIARLWIAVAVANLLVLLMVGIAVENSRSAYERQAEVTVENLSAILDHTISGSIERIDQTLLIVIDEIQRQQAAHGTIDDTALDAFLAKHEQRLPEALGVRVTDADGNIRHAISNVKTPRGNISGYEHFEYLKTHPSSGLVVSKPLLGKISNQWLVVFARRWTRPNGDFGGQVHVSVPIQHFIALFSTLSLGPHGAVTLWNSVQPVIVGRYALDDHDGLSVGVDKVSPQLRAILADGRSTAIYHARSGADGVERLNFFRRLHAYGVPLFLVVGTSENDYLRPWRHETGRLAAGALAFLLLSLLSTTALARTWTRQEELARMNAAVISTSKAAVQVFGPEGDCILANDAAARITGGSLEDLLHQNIFHIPSWAESGILAAAEQALATGQTTHVSTHTTSTFGRDIWIEGDFSTFDTEGRRVLMLVVNDVTQQKQAEARLRTSESRLTRMVEDLDQSNRELEQFAYVASHDLREPLRMISSYVTLLERRYHDSLDSAALEFIGFAREGAQRMDRMVLDLLELSRIGRLCDPFAAVALSEAARTAQTDLSAIIAETGAVIQEPDCLPTVTGSFSELSRLFQNLIGNAIKYRHAERPPRISIEAADGGTEWIISIRDNGIGIEPEFRERIFQIFQRLHTREHYDGTGIGLAVCRKIVQHHDGRIWVEGAEDGGSIFRFTLPKMEG